jgi:hypothetical protein
MPELPHVMPERASDFDFGFLSMALVLKRGLNGHDAAQSGAAAGLSSVTIGRIERGDALAIGIVVRACKYMNIHCFSYLSVTDTPSNSKKINEAKAPPLNRSVARETLPRKRAEDLSPLAILVRKRGHELRRAEATGRALERLEGTDEYADAFNRHQRYLASVAALTLSIDQLRQAEGKEVKAFGSLGAV